jgi:hypothetical protein
VGDRNFKIFIEEMGKLLRIKIICKIRK